MIGLGTARFSFSGSNAGARTFLMRNSDKVYINVSSANGCGSIDGSAFTYQLVNGALKFIDNIGLP